LIDLEKLDNNTYAILEVRYPQCSPILQEFVLLRVINFIIDVFGHKTTTSELKILMKNSKSNMKAYENEQEVTLEDDKAPRSPHSLSKELFTLVLGFFF
jgi:hypothetical protein